MIIDFHIHYTPEEFLKDKFPPGGGNRVDYAQGLPMYIHHPALYRLEGHLEAMDVAGVDVAVLSSGAWLESKVSEGGTASARVREQLDRARAALAGG